MGLQQKFQYPRLEILTVLHLTQIKVGYVIMATLLVASKELI
jgi:hypothetical protein